MLRVSHLSKSFNSEEVLKDLTFTLPAHKTMSILGRSGSGKTTLLKVIAGLTAPDEGELFWNNKDLNRLKPAKREIIYLYQESLLFPHMNLFDNIAFGLRVRKTSKDQIQERTQTMIQKLELAGMEQKMPHQLSGGQKQRVSFGRALIVNPRVLLLDEPFGNLDVETRENMQELFKEIACEFDITSIFVTHNLKEAILMGDCIAYMYNGKLKPYDTIRDFIESDETGVQDEIAFWKDLAG